MIITAQFIGDPSLGYRTGKTYVLRISDHKGMSISRIDGTGKCAYESISAMLRNWTDIKTDIENSHENPTT